MIWIPTPGSFGAVSTIVFTVSNDFFISLLTESRTITYSLGMHLSYEDFDFFETNFFVTFSLFKVSSTTNLTPLGVSGNGRPLQKDG